MENGKCFFLSIFFVTGLFAYGSPNGVIFDTLHYITSYKCIVYTSD